MDAETLLKNEEDKALLMERLEELMQRHGFDKKIEEFVDNAIGGKLPDIADVNWIFDKLYDFVILNLPPEVQEAFYHDVRSFIERNTRFEN
ncbi:hypothetical protein EHEL_070965 [Encephalitozoon hellem ATCC 50504]|uniref:Uncharacterized protein n=1 Tax=Encephalitozoon hellem TaxID=27973 RepID=A0A9Q9F8F3_ENCHE|nr:uncharacterized protein EHEL_070965 [Encephalitozoon hellem ATCC 50504]AHL28950.1 hypothetical protein EHEL_070965 [Encephalitozoon hellem ATCC 50504]UTX43569.1 hypothetical protein GPU96_07g13300 [Encephalitozoon hellem]